MFDKIPVQSWLLIAIVALAWMPARYVFRYVTHSPSRSDITQPVEDLSWRSSGTLAKSVAMLASLTALAVFIFTRAAAEFAQSPNLATVLFLGFGVFGLWTVIKGYRTDVVEPMVRGASWEFSRSEQPKRYWASMAWNALLTALSLFGGIQSLIDAPVDALRNRCHDWKDEWSAREALAACNQLLAEHPDDDRAGVIAARGNAFYDLRDYRRAGADYAAAIRLDPQQSFSHYNLGLVNEQLGDDARAIAEYGAAIRIEPKNADAYLNRGLLLVEAGRLEPAIADLTRVHELQPTKLAPLASRGIAYALKNDAARAQQDFAVVRRSDPSNLDVFRGEALLAIARGDMTGGIRLLDEAIARDPKNAWAIRVRVQVYRQLSEHDRMTVDAAAAQRSAAGERRQ